VFKFLELLHSLLYILGVLQYWHSLAQLPHLVAADWQSEFISVAQSVWHNSLRYTGVIPKFKSITSTSVSQGVLIFKRTTSVASVSQGDFGSPSM